MAPALRLKIAQLPPRRRRPGHIRRPVHLLRQRQRLILRRRVAGIQIGHGRIAGAGRHYRLRQFLAPGAAPRVAVAFHGGVGAGRQRNILHRRQFIGAVRAKAIDGNHRRQPETLDDANVMRQVVPAGAHPLRIRLRQLPPQRPAVPLQRPRRSHHHRRARHNVPAPRFDVHKLLKAQIRRKPRFGNHIVGVGHPHPVGDNRVAPVGNVGERPGVHQRRLPFQRLRQVRHHRLMQQRHQRAGEPQLRYAHRISTPRAAHHNPPHPLPQVVKVVRQRQNRHNLRCRDDAEPRFPQRPVAVAAHAGHHLTQAPVGSVGNPRPGNAVSVKIRDGVPKHRVVHQRGQQVVRRCHRVGIPGEVDINLFLRHYPRRAAAGAAALDAENRPQRRLPQRRHDALPQPTQPLGQPDGGSGLPLPGRRRRNAGHHHQLALAARRGTQRIQRNLRLVPPVRQYIFGVNSQLLGDIGNVLHLVSLLLLASFLTKTCRFR